MNLAPETHPFAGEFTAVGELTFGLLEATGDEARVSTFKADKQALTAKLMAAGIAPLAVVEVDQWAAIRRRYGLYSLFIGRKGARFEIPQAWLRHETVAYHEEPRFTKDFAWCTDEALALVENMDRDDLLRALMPSGESVHFNVRVKHALRLRPQLPQMPRRTKGVMNAARTHDLQPHIVAESAAIGLSGFQVASAMHEGNARATKRAQYWEERDPIACVPQGSATALIEQWGGDFPFEAKALREAIAAHG